MLELKRRHFDVRPFHLQLIIYAIKRVSRRNEREAKRMATRSVVICYNTWTPIILMQAKFVRELSNLCNLPSVTLTQHVLYNSLKEANVSPSRADKIEKISRVALRRRVQCTLEAGLSSSMYCSRCAFLAVFFVGVTILLNC